MRDYIGSHPYWYYDRVTLGTGGVSAGPQRLIYQVKESYDYLLQGFCIRVGPDSDLNDIGPPISLMVNQTERGLTLHSVPIPCDLFATPGVSGYVNRDRANTYFLRYNYLFSTRSAIELIVSGQANGEPVYCEVLTVGRNIKRR